MIKERYNSVQVEILRKFIISIDEKDSRLFHILFLCYIGWVDATWHGI